MEQTSSKLESPGSHKVHDKVSNVHYPDSAVSEEASASNNSSLCPLSADIKEFKKYYGVLKETMHRKDLITDVKLLKTIELKQIQPYERCCFLLQLGNFYMSNVFPVVDSAQVQRHRDITHLANYMLGIKKSQKDCHVALKCPCGSHSHNLMKNFKDEYFKMETGAAAIKAVGELNILFHWIESNHHSQ
ncbi:interleukin-20-like [Hyperolius riggenbachi]|uniref:interleukin-20-like n=1 Tax=Hyperolius riggenbachi TaxID=752182 RepID=UPI0035A2A916